LEKILNLASLSASRAIKMKAAARFCFMGKLFREK